MEVYSWEVHSTSCIADFAELWLDFPATELTTGWILKGTIVMSRCHWMFLLFLLGGASPEFAGKVI